MRENPCELSLIGSRSQTKDGCPSRRLFSPGGYFPPPLTSRWNRSQPASENLRIFRSNFARAQIAVGVIPTAYPVDRPGDCKRDQLRIARPDGAVGNSLLHIASKSRIQAPLHGSNLAPGSG